MVGAKDERHPNAFTPGRVFCSILSVAFLSLFFQFVAQGQSRALFTGTVVDAETGVAIPGAHVFLINTTIGGATDQQGSFQIEHIPPGSYEVAVSMLGYQRTKSEITLSPGDNPSLRFELTPTIYAIDDITVVGQVPKHWKRNLKWFKGMFLGQSPNRGECDIVNDTQLVFNTPGVSIEAHSDVPLVIENRSLGYQLTYQLNQFTGSATGWRYQGEPFFEDLEPKNEREKRRWEENRAETYNGSFQHFLRVLGQNTADSQRFSAYIMPNATYNMPFTKLRHAFGAVGQKVALSDLLLQTKVPYEYELIFPDFLFVVYEGETTDRSYYTVKALGYAAIPEPQVSVLQQLEYKMVFNAAGFLNATYSVARYGYWNFESGVCDMLPFDYGLESQ